MAIINPDLSEVTSGKLTPGTKKAKITAVDVRTAKSSGNPMIVPTFEVEEDGNTYTREAYLVITGKGAFNFEQLLRACHFDDVADKLRTQAPGDKLDFDTDQLIGQELNVIVEDEAYNGEMRDKIRSYVKA